MDTHGSNERMKDITEAFTPWLDQVFLTVINMKTNGDVYQKHQHNYIDEIYIVNQTTPYLNLYGMERNPVLINPETLYVTYTP